MNKSESLLKEIKDLINKIRKDLIFYEKKI